MAYVKIIYQNSPSTATPINAENLNHMDDQIALNDQRLTEIETAYVKSFNGRKGEVTPQAGDYDMSQITPTSGATVGQIPIVRNDGTEEEPNLTFHMEDVPSSGHVIQNASGTDMAQEDAMQFPDSFVSDDAVNGKTIVENIKEVSPADYDSTTDEGIIVGDDGNDALIGLVSDDKVEVTADGVKPYRQLLLEIWEDSKFDISKITYGATLVIGANVLSLVYISSTVAKFACIRDVDNDHEYSVFATLESPYPLYMNVTDTNTSNESSIQCPNGTVITLHYGNKKAVVDLQTTANRCLMSDGVTSVEEAIVKGFIRVTGDGVKTIAQLLNDMYSQIDFSKISGSSTLRRGYTSTRNVFQLYLINPGYVAFTRVTRQTATPKVQAYEIGNGTSTYYENEIDLSATVAGNGENFELYY